MQAQRIVLDPEVRKALLWRDIVRYGELGYRVVSQTEYTAKLSRPKPFNLAWFFSSEKYEYVNIKVPEEILGVEFDADNLKKGQ